MGIISTKKQIKNMIIDEEIDISPDYNENSLNNYTKWEVGSNNRFYISERKAHSSRSVGG